MSIYYCLYCKYYEPIINGSNGTEPEGICNFLPGINLVYGHECCENFSTGKEE